MSYDDSNHYAALGLNADCTDDDIRMAYRALAKRYHPDVNQHSPDAMEKTHAIIEAYKILGNKTLRMVYDKERAVARQSSLRSRSSIVDIKQDVLIGVEDFLRGISLNVDVNDPANPGGMETYELDVPPDTAPGARFRMRRMAPFDGGYIIVRVKMRPDMRFKARGSDLRCDLQIDHRLAAAGGAASVNGAAGNYIHMDIPENCPRGEVIKIAGEGLPKSRGGRGDLLVRIMYQPEVRIARSSSQCESHAQRRRLS